MFAKKYRNFGVEDVTTGKFPYFLNQVSLFGLQALFKVISSYVVDPVEWENGQGLDDIH